MNRWLIPPMTLAAAFVAYYYPDERHPPLSATTSAAFATPAAAPAPGPALLRAARLAPLAGHPGLVKVASAASDPRPMMDAREAAVRWNKLEALMKCAKDDGCRLPETDSRARAFAVRDALLAEGRWFLERRAEGPAAERKSYRAASRLLAFPDEAVQGLALQWMLTLPAKDETVGQLRMELDTMVDPELVRLSFLELKRHMGTEREGDALDLVGHVLLEGGIFASREAARLAPTLLDAGNEDRFRGWLAELPPESAKARLLREGLEAARGGA